MTQLLHYQTGIYNKSKDPVVTVLFYTGRKKKWSGPPELSRVFKLSKELKEAFFKGKENLQKIIFNMLKEKMEISFITKVTGLSEKEIKKLKNKTLKT